MKRTRPNVQKLTSGDSNSGQASPTPSSAAAAIAALGWLFKRDRGLPPAAKCCRSFAANANRLQSFISGYFTRFKDSYCGVA